MRIFFNLSYFIKWQPIYYFYNKPNNVQENTYFGNSDISVFVIKQLFKRYERAFKLRLTE